MKRPRISILATLCATALASAGATAHDPYPGVEGHDLPPGSCAMMGQWPYGTFVSVDSNGDGYIDRTEVVAGSPWYPYFTPMDANGDGRITLAESNAYTGAWRHDRWPFGTFVQVDRNGDGYIDRTEVVDSSPWYPYYTPMDANGDGRISLAESDAYTSTWHGDFWPYGNFVSVDRNGDGFVDSTEVVATSPWYPYFTPMDANGDGRISLAESNAYTSAYRPDRWPYGTFVQVDRNGDGFIDRTEVVATSPWYPYINPMDTNRDGRVTRGEADAYTTRWSPGPWPNWSFVGVDSNHDGFIDRTEVVATSPMHPHFDQIDSNDDSRATQEEVEVFWRTMAHSGGTNTACQHMMAHDAGADAPRDVSDKGPAPSFRSSDQNGDGFLSRDELGPGDMLLGHFAQADSNNDGRLSSGEVDAHNAVMAEMGKKR